MSTTPRRIIPGTTYLITRRCTQGQLLLQPSAATRELVAFILAYTANRYGIELHAFCFLSNHYNLVATDPEGRICGFLQQFHSLVARALNAHYGRSENFWSTESASLVELVESDDVVDKILETLCSPASAFLVEDSSHWPGLRSDVKQGAVALELEKPSFFRDKGSVPDEFELRTVPPPGWSHAEFSEHIHSLVEEREKGIRETARANGRRFLGLRKIRRQSHREFSRTAASSGEGQAQIACKNPTRRQEEFQKRKRFLEDYRDALSEFSRGVRNVIFPYGTYLMKQLFGVRVVMLE